MTPNSAPAFHILSTPVVPPRAASQGSTGAPESSHEPVPDAPESPAGGGSPRGRSGGYSERVLAMVCAAIREYGLSDSAAAVKTGMSAPTLAQWKREFPEIEVKLQQAREECRIQQLQIVMRFAQAENACGLRAATWLLERLFPGDYAPRARERAAHRDLDTQARERESSDAFYQKLREEQAERDARFAKANREYQEALATYEAQQAAEAAQPVETGAPAEPAAESRASASGTDLHIVQNSAAAEAGQAGTHAPALRTASVDPLHNVQNPPAEPHEGRPEPVQNSRTVPESALHNVKNYPSPTVAPLAGSGERIP